MESYNIPHYKDFWWDTAPPEERQHVTLREQVIPLLLYAKERVPFYRVHYQRISRQTIQGLQDLDDFATVIPCITKVHLAANHPQAFMPEGAGPDHSRVRGKYWRFGTGGTTSKPILVIHSMADWRAMVLHANRYFEYDFYRDPVYSTRFVFDRDGLVDEDFRCLSTPLAGTRIFGAYNADHITNNIYCTMLTALGCDFYWRASTRASVADNYDLMRNFQVNGILAPPEDPSNRQTKGTTLDAFLRLDALSGNGWKMNHKHNKDFRFVFWSSMPISRELIGHLRDDRHIPYIKGNFGSTEVCPTATTCSRHPRSFHLGYGPSLVLAKRLDLKGLAAADEPGFLLVSKLGATNLDGRNTCPSGMIFLNYMTGDSARLSQDGHVCACGRNTPRLYDMQRIGFHQGKAVHGCQVD